MLTLATGGTLAGKAGTAAAVTCTVFGDEISTTDAFRKLYQGVLGTGAATLYTVPASTQTIVKTIELVNTTVNPVTGVTFYVDGTAAGNQISPGITLPASGAASYSDSVWSVYGSDGILVTTVGGAAGGDLSGSYPNPTVNNDAVTNAKLANMATATFKGRTTAGTGDPEDLTVAQATALLNASTVALKGLQSAIDKAKEDNLYYDVTANSIANLVGDGSTDNASLWTTFFAGLPVGAHVHFPAGTYNTSAEFTISADKHLRITGNGKYSATIRSTSTTAHIFHINGSYWYNTFEDLRFDSTVTKTAGSAIHINPGASGSAVGTNIARCSFVNQFVGVYALSSGTAGQAANLSVWDSLDIASGPVNSRGIIINGGTTNLLLTNSTINLGYPPFQVAGTACIEIQQSGAVQIVAGEFIGGTNTLLLNANVGGSSSIAAVYVTNTYFDQSAGSTVKVTGANVTNRCKFVQCGITGGNVAGAVAVEIASSGTGAAGAATAAADGINFIDCDIYPNGGSGTIDGFKITGAQGVAISNSRISGWTNGIEVTPAAANGYTKIFIDGNKMGATNNFTTPNTVGVLLNAGSFQYGAIVIGNNDFSGSTTPITDNSTIASSGQKLIDGNFGLPLGTVNATTKQALTTVDTVIAQIPIPQGSLRIGSAFRISGYLARTAATASVLNIRARFGTAGTNADAQVILMAPASPATANTATRFEMIVVCRAIGNGTTNLTATGHTASQVNNANSVAAYTSSFMVGGAQALTTGNSTVANFLTLTIANVTSSTTDVYVANIEVLAQ